MKRIVEFMDGDITVDSEAGLGTTVYLHLLLADAVQTESDGGDKVLAPVLSDLRPLRVLLADDEPIGQMSMKVMLKRLGHDVVTANNGEQVLRAFQREDFDCILMDVQMPEMDGVSATHVIRSTPGFGEKSRMPIVAMAAYAMPGDREKFLQAGTDDYVSKPVQMEELKKALERAEKRMQGKIAPQVLGRKLAVEGGRAQFCPGSPPGKAALQHRPGDLRKAKTGHRLSAIACCCSGGDEGASPGFCVSERFISVSRQPTSFAPGFAGRVPERNDG